MKTYLAAIILIGLMLLTTAFIEIPKKQIRDNTYPDSIISGRDIYISEGCIHCHSQYVRPRTSDTALYGPATPVRTDKTQPVLIGNRRQGPDLSNVGLRKTREWHKLHLINPPLVSPGSRMPSYAHLFDDSDKGEVLLDYLISLQPNPLSE